MSSRRRSRALPRRLADCRGAIGCYERLEARVLLARQAVVRVDSVSAAAALRTTTRAIELQSGDTVAAAPLARDEPAIVVESPNATSAADAYTAPSYDAASTDSPDTRALDSNTTLSASALDDGARSPLLEPAPATADTGASTQLSSTKPESNALSSDALASGTRSTDTLISGERNSSTQTSGSLASSMQSTSSTTTLATGGASTLSDAVSLTKASRYLTLTEPVRIDAQPASTSPTQILTASLSPIKPMYDAVDVVATRLVAAKLDRFSNAAQAKAPGLADADDASLDQNAQLSAPSGVRGVVAAANAQDESAPPLVAGLIQAPAPEGKGDAPVAAPAPGSAPEATTSTAATDRQGVSGDDSDETGASQAQTTDPTWDAAAAATDADVWDQALLTATDEVAAPVALADPLDHVTTPIPGALPMVSGAALTAMLGPPLSRMSAAMSADEGQLFQPTQLGPRTVGGKERRRRRAGARPLAAAPGEIASGVWQTVPPHPQAESPAVDYTWAIYGDSPWEETTIAAALGGTISLLAADRYRGARRRNHRQGPRLIGPSYCGPTLIRE